ncbi:hypothetical protein V7014_22870, partial [Bacillus sp. JJ722]
QNGHPVSNYIFKDVFVLAKYFHHTEKLDDESIRIKLENFINYKEQSYDVQKVFRRMIEGAIKGSKKQYMKQCNEVSFTENEIAIINKMKDTTTRKIAFTLLCMWKANSNKPFRSSIHQVANEIELKANGEKLSMVYYDLLRQGSINRYNRTAEKRKRILQKMVEIDGQYGGLFIPYDSLKYAEHVSSPTRKSSIAIWMYTKDFGEYPSFDFPSFYVNMSDVEKEDYKKYRYKEDDYDYVSKNFDVIAHCYTKESFAQIIGGSVFYNEEKAHDKVKVLFADNDNTQGLLIDVNDLLSEYNKLFGANRVVYGNCKVCGCNIIKKSNKTKYCTGCREQVRKEKVKENMRNMRKKQRM